MAIATAIGAAIHLRVIFLRLSNGWSAGTEGTKEGSIRRIMQPLASVPVYLVVPVIFGVLVHVVVVHKTWRCGVTYEGWWRSW